MLHNALPIFVVILAGGNGERLWPLSTQDCPKQLLRFDKGACLLEKTVERVSSLVDNEHCIILTTQKQQPAIEQIVGSKATIMAEPSGRNTAPALLLATLTIAKKDPNAIILFLPADHHIPDTEIFVKTLQEIVHTANTYQKICLLGLKPTYPATGYGYIEYDPTHHPHRITKFHEKPALPQAQHYTTRQNMLWNVGIFGGSVATFIQEFTQHAPQLVAQMQCYQEGKCSYDELESISFDYAIMEKSSQALVLPAHFTWSDVGNLVTFLTLQHDNYLTPQNKIYTVDARNNLVAVPHKIVGLIGVDDLCIVQTNEALLIAHQNSIENVKKIVAQLSSE